MFNPDEFFAQWSVEGEDTSTSRWFSQKIRQAFSIDPNDKYRYHAVGSTTLDEAQVAINAKGKGGLHDWYRNPENQVIGPPSSDDAKAYTALFAPSAHPTSALKNFRANAKKDSLRAEIADYLLSKYHVGQNDLLRSKKAREISHVNPYYDMWKYSCEELEWAGPWKHTGISKISHHILPVFYHHFGCICPSYQALWVIAQLAQPSAPKKGKPVRPIFDIGSGNGYWTYMLRHLPLHNDMKALEVHPVDNGVSTFRTQWIPDTVVNDGVAFLQDWKTRRDAILLLVYPQTTGDFTESVLSAFKGDTIVVAGTQNSNGFTAFADWKMDDWMATHMPEFPLVFRLPLPSFANKDEALFVFRKKDGL